VQATFFFHLLLLKKSIQTALHALFFFHRHSSFAVPPILLLVRGRYQLRAITEEPHQPFQILCRRCQVKLFAYELDPA
jgi:hypothetical protein